MIVASCAFVVRRNHSIGVAGSLHGVRVVDRVPVSIIDTVTPFAPHRPDSHFARSAFLRGAMGDVIDRLKAAPADRYSI